MYKNPVVSGLENVENALSSFKSYLKRTIDSEINGDHENVTGPQLGFKVSYDEEKGVLVAKVIGAKQLPATFGSSSPRGYLVKVRLKTKCYIENNAF